MQISAPHFNNPLVRSKTERLNHSFVKNLQDIDAAVRCLQIVCVMKRKVCIAAFCSAKSVKCASFRTSIRGVKFPAIRWSDRFYSSKNSRDVVGDAHNSATIGHFAHMFAPVSNTKCTGSNKRR
uniref:Transposase n=1 Tax=Ascaris lumbricoides TaxID=6252 RepID=A0A0M3IA88_ASCLU